MPGVHQRHPCLKVLGAKASIKSRDTPNKTLCGDFDTEASSGITAMSVLNVTPGASPAPNIFLPELLVEILAHLSLEDVLACQLVSRAWYAAFTGPVAISALCRRFFPALPRPYAVADFQAECRRLLRRRRGDFAARLDHAVSCDGGGFPLDEAFHPGGLAPSPALWESDVMMVGYGEGNIVWTPGSGRLCVDNLHTRKRRVLDTRNWPAFVLKTVARVSGSVLLHHGPPKSV